MKRHLLTSTAALAAALLAPHVSHAADWSDTAISLRAGSQFREPFNANEIRKDIIGLTHASGYKYGTNFFNVDFLLSDSKDPAGKGSTEGAQEAYVVYRHTLDLAKVTGSPYKWGLVRGMGVVAGFDVNTKTDAGYNSKKRMLVAGPVLMLDVPGFVNVGLLQLWESNAPFNTFSGVATPRYNYAPHPMLNLTWGIPFTIGSAPLKFSGFANYITAKGKNEFGADTAPETNIDMQLMWDLTQGAKHGFLVGLQYQYWNNKFGNDASGLAGGGATAKTPMLRVEYHF
ncbi:MAG: outer envelope protein [Rhodoferax sp.]|nr:outer envelope protein [Rhodoferax sp.]